MSGYMHAWWTPVAWALLTLIERLGDVLDWALGRRP